MAKITKKRFEELSSIWQNSRIVVLGDVVLDTYIWGSAERLSPEAPVPVVTIESENAVLGGAGNVAANITALGAKAHLLSVRGNDEEGKILEKLFLKSGIDHTLFVDAGRPTTTKLRIIGQGQQIVRVDKESTKPVSTSIAKKLHAHYIKVLSDATGTIIEDYDKGVITDETMRLFMKAAQKAKQKVFIDPKNKHWKLCAGAELVKPNQKEAEQATGIRLHDKQAVTVAGKALIKMTKAKTIAITRGKEGMAFFNASRSLFVPQTARRRVADPTGAGDTVIATLSLARTAGATWEEAALIANAAAAVVVGKAGTSTLSLGELSETLF